MRTLRRLGAAGGAALLSAALVAQAGSAFAADPVPVTDQLGAMASGQVLDLSLLGRRMTFGSAAAESTLDAISRKLNASATGLGTLLAPATKSVAAFGDANATGGKNCAVPQLLSLLGGLGGAAGTAGALPLDVAGILPSVNFDAACGEAHVSGNADAFTAESSGNMLKMSVKLSKTFEDLVGTIRSTFTPVLDQTVGSLLSNTVPSVTNSLPLVNSLNGLLGTIVPGVGLNELNPAQTVDDLFRRLQSTDLVRISLGSANARNIGDPANYISEAITEGGSIEILPGLAAADLPLLKVIIGESKTNVAVDRMATKAAAKVKNTTVRIESSLLESLPIAGGLVSNGLVGGLPLGSILGGNLPVVGGLLGGGLPLGDLVKGLGVNSGPGYIELAPGQSVSIFCDGGLLNALCSEISVGAAKAPEVLANGRTRVEASAVSVHLFKNLNSLLPVAIPGVNLGTILGEGLVGSLLAPLTSAAGLNLGEATDIQGIKLSLANAVSEAGGVKVMGAVQEQARQAAPAAAPVSLPRTGGSPLEAAPYAVPVLLGASAGLRMLIRRRRSL